MTAGLRRLRFRPSRRADDPPRHVGAVPGGPRAALCLLHHRGLRLRHRGRAGRPHQIEVHEPASRGGRPRAQVGVLFWRPSRACRGSCAAPVAVLATCQDLLPRVARAAPLPSAARMLGMPPLPRVARAHCQALRACWGCCHCRAPAACLPAGRYSSMAHCLGSTVRSEGVRALWKGWAPSCLRLGPHTCVSLLIFEQLRRLAGLAPI